MAIYETFFGLGQPARVRGESPGGELAPRRKCHTYHEVRHASGVTQIRGEPRH